MGFKSQADGNKQGKSIINNENMSEDQSQETE